MPTPVPEGLVLTVVQPQEAVAAFQARGLLAVTFSWLDLWTFEHSRAFTISRLAERAVLAWFQRSLGAAVADGTRLDEWAKAAKQKLVQSGWWGRREVTEPGGETFTTVFNPARLQLIYEVNTRHSYAAGRWARIQRTKATLPFVLYRTMRDERVRASHRPWDGLALPVDHPFWRTHYPPNGWRCRCTAFAVSERQLDRYRAAGFEIKTTAPKVEYLEFTNKRTGSIEFVPRGIDPGFGYNPGAGGDPLMPDGQAA